MKESIFFRANFFPEKERIIYGNLFPFRILVERCGYDESLLNWDGVQVRDEVGGIEIS